MSNQKDYEKTVYALAGLYAGRVIAVSAKAGDILEEINKTILRLEQSQK